MPTGIVTKDALALLDGPDGQVLSENSALPLGAKVDIKLDEGDGWLLVSTELNGVVRFGYVDGCFVKSTDNPLKAPMGVFPDVVIAAARKSNADWSIPASVTLAQWALESTYGRSTPSGSNNPFGIKGKPGAGSVQARTREVNKAGESYYIYAWFQNFPNLDAAFDAHGKLLATFSPYATARTFLPDPFKFADALTGVYASDPSYGGVLKSIINSHSLTKYDS